jgi:hypothetical protein
VFHLGYFREPTGLTRVNYRDMGPEELGSVYESLLELVPDPQNLAQPHAARLAFVGDDDADASTKGNTRKLTGSYYTPDPLVQELIKSALEPVIADTVKSQSAAAGRGAAAAHRSATRPAAAATSCWRRPAAWPTRWPSCARPAAHPPRPTTATPCATWSAAASSASTRTPWPSQLAKTALWLEAYTPDRPLSFLDHHLQVGDALLGVLDPKVLENGIPDEAYAVLSGDDKETASALKKQNKADLKSWKAIAAGDLFAKTGLATQADAVEHLADDSLAGIEAKRAAWAQAEDEARHSTWRGWPTPTSRPSSRPSCRSMRRASPCRATCGASSTASRAARNGQAATELCRAHGVFHWWLAFPQVRFAAASRSCWATRRGSASSCRRRSSSRPAARWWPWPRTRPSAPSASSGCARACCCTTCSRSRSRRRAVPTQPGRDAALRGASSRPARRRGRELFAHDSGRYPLTGVGDVNTYATLFAESFYQADAPTGRAGFIVPTGIATDDSTKAYFGAISQRGNLPAL